MEVLRNFEVLYKARLKWGDVINKSNSICLPKSDNAIETQYEEEIG